MLNLIAITMLSPLLLFCGLWIIPWAIYALLKDFDD